MKAERLKFRKQKTENGRQKTEISFFSVFCLLFSEIFMHILYDLAFLLFGIVYLPYLIVTKRYKYGLGDRVGILPKRIRTICSKSRIIWIHAVSVGEIKAASILAPLLRKNFPSHTLLFSTVTHTGNKVARTIAAGNEDVFYLPFDLSFIVNRVVGVIRPEMFLCLETELWPNLINSLNKANAKIVLINGRISNKSYFGYKKIRRVVSNILKKFSLILMQSEQDAVRALTLGAPKEKVFITGNLKFDLSLLDSAGKRREIRERLSLNEEDVLLIAGSTHKGEESYLIDCYMELKKDYNNLRLFIAPRHIERTQEITELSKRRGLNPVQYSNLASNSHQSPASSIEHQASSIKYQVSSIPSLSLGTGKYQAPNTDTIFILDTIGELKSMYYAADIVFIGGSLVQKGGQNPIEPASMGKPVILGRYTFNFQDVVRSFLENGACIQVGNKDELCSALRLLLNDPRERKKIGMNAKDTVRKNSGSSQRSIDLICSIG